MIVYYEWGAGESILFNVCNVLLFIESLALFNFFPLVKGSLGTIVEVELNYINDPA